MHGHHDFQLSDDVLHKVHIGHYTFYSKAIVKNSKYMIRAPGVFVREYVGGEDTGGTWIEDQTAPKSLTKASDEEIVKLGDVVHRDEFYAGGKDPGGSKGLANRTLYGTASNDYYIRGTCYNKRRNTVTRKTVNTLGFGEHTYPGCKYAREGRGVALSSVTRTLESMI
jgi:hypothetical protein